MEDNNERRGFWDFACEHPFIFWFLTGGVIGAIKHLITMIAYAIRPELKDKCSLQISNDTDSEESSSEPTEDTDQ